MPTIENQLRDRLSLNTPIDQLNLVNALQLPDQDPIMKFIKISGLNATNRVLLLNDTDHEKFRNIHKAHAKYEPSCNVAVLAENYDLEHMVHEITHGNGLIYNSKFSDSSKYFQLHHFGLTGLTQISLLCQQNGIYLNNRHRLHAIAMQNCHNLQVYLNKLQTKCNPNRQIFTDISLFDSVSEMKEFNQLALQTGTIKETTELDQLSIQLLLETEAELVTAFLTQPTQNLLGFAKEIYYASNRTIDPIRFAGSWYKMTLVANGFKLEKDAQIEKRRKSIRRLFTEG